MITVIGIVLVIGPPAHPSYSETARMCWVSGAYENAIWVLQLVSR
jgi:hypothetical protein